jgi:hypothetical protein
LVPVGKHVNNIRAISGQSPTATIEKLLEAVFPVGSAPRLYNEDSMPPERVQVWDIRLTATTGAQKLKNLHS